MAKTAAERKRKEREARRNAGLVAVTVWVRPEHVQSVHEFVTKITIPQTRHLTAACPAND